MNKRILSLLLAVIMFLPAEGVQFYADGLTKWQAYALDEQEGQEQNDPVYSSEANAGDMIKPSEQEPDQQEPDPGQEEETEKQEYTLEFQLGGGVTAEGETDFSMKVTEGELPDATAVPEVMKKGYLFRGWQTADGGYYKFDAPMEGDLSLFASWAPITYRVQFDLNGGNGDEIPERIFTYDKEELLPVKVGQKPGHVFWGWKQQDTGFYQSGTSVKNLTDQDGQVVVLTAIWKRGRYKIQFDANGGSGTMAEQTIVCGRSKKLNGNQYKNPGYAFVGWNTQKDGKGKNFANKQEVNFQDKESGDTVILYAMWQGNPYQVTYDGNGAVSGSVKPSSHIYGTAKTLNACKYKRKGYIFAGWNTQKDGKGKTYKTDTKVKNLTTKLNGSVTLYAKWKAQTYTITYDTKGGNLSKSAKNTYKITTKTFMLPAPTRKGYDFDGWYKDAKLKKRVGKINSGSTGNRKYYAKWIKCSATPRKDSAKLTTCKATGAGKVKVSATLKKRVVSDDDRYYLVYVNPVTKKPYKTAKDSYKKNKITFNLKTSENQGYAVSMLGIAVKKKGQYKLISSTSYVGSAEKAAKNKSAYKLGKTKKGIQFCNTIQELDNCGAKNNFLNMTVSTVTKDGNVPYQYNGITYYFNRLDFQRQVVAECNRKGINVTMQVMLDWVDGWTDLIYSKARVKGAAPYYSWNVNNNAAREKMEAIFSYLGSIFGTKKCYVSNWILGNEVNNPKEWNYKGRMAEKTYFTTYAHAFRSLYYAVRSQYSNARVYICTDNLWNTSVAEGYSAKHTIKSFVKYLNKIQKGLKWNLAYHGYSSPLTYTNFWDGYGITNNINTPYITMKNLHILTRWIQKKYGSSVRVILSEQGYSSTWGQANQAAALAASYYIAACNPMVDAFIIRSYYDHPVEVAMGLSMGIYGKEAFKVFKNMDTSQSLRYTKRYLKLIGIKSWKKLVPGYNKSRLSKMYRKG